MAFMTSRRLQLYISGFTLERIGIASVGMCIAQTEGYKSTGGKEMAQQFVVTWENIPGDIQEEIRHHRRWYIFQGILYIVAGALAVILPVMTALAVEILLGALLLLGGISKIVTSIGKHESVWSWASAALAILTGALMLWNPWAGLTALSALVTVFLVFEGVAEILFAYRFKPLSGWGWLLAAGIISLLLGFGGLILFPIIGMIYIGVALGISLLFYGVALLTVIGGLNTVRQ